MKALRTKDYKALARKLMIGKYGTAIGVSCLSFLINLPIVIFLIIISFIVFSFFAMNLTGYNAFFSIALGSEAVVVASIIIAAFVFLLIILSCLLIMGNTKLYLNIARGEKYGVGDLFYAFKKGSRPISYLFTLLALTILTGIFDALTKFLPGFIFMATGSYIASAAVLILIWLVLYFYVIWGFNFAALIRIDRPETGFFKAFSESFKYMKRRRLKLILLGLSFIPWIFLVYVSFFIALLWVMPYATLTGVLFYLDARGELFPAEEAVASANEPYEPAAEEIRRVPAAPLSIEEGDTDGRANYKASEEAEPGDKEPFEDKDEACARPETDKPADTCAVREAGDIKESDTSDGEHEKREEDSNEMPVL